jgi:hypothetical protein
MPLDIHTPLKPDGKWPPEFHTSLDDDGYYWFMYPYFEKLAAKTGQLLDLYGGATFEGEALQELRAIVATIREAVCKMPLQWEVQTGDSIGSYPHTTPPQPIYAGVERITFLALLAQLDAVVDGAIRRDTSVVARGD